LAEKKEEAEATAGGRTQHIVSQLLVASHAILPGRGLGQCFVHRGFFWLRTKARSMLRGCTAMP
jgi:hypothetical protein